MNTWGLLASITISFTASALFAAILCWFDRYEKEPVLLLGTVFIWGALVAAGGAFIINTFLGLSVYVVTGSEAATNFATSALIAPVIEEVLKGFAVLLVFLVFYSEFDSILDGILYAGVAALGFAATENAYYIYTYGFIEEGWQGFWTLAFIRLGLVGWQHPFYTAFVGIGLAAARLNRNILVRITAPIIGLGCAITAHFTHNLLTSLFPGVAGTAFTTIVDWIGWLFMLGFIFIVMLIERRDIKAYLKDEISKQTITSAQFETATSAFRVSIERIKAFFQGRYRNTTRFYRGAAELALKKKQLKRFGEERGNRETVENLRKEVSRLSTVLKAIS